MRGRRILRVFEHDVVTNRTKCSAGRVVGKPAIETLWAYNDAHQNRYFTNIRDGIKLTSYVGVLQVGGLTIEILPKADRGRPDEAVWHAVLLRMLEVCRSLPRTAPTEAHLTERRRSILDLYLALYLDEVDGLMRRGLAKRYRRQDGQVTALKGQWLFGEHLRRNLVHKERFYTRHQVYDHDHRIHRILRRGLEVVDRIHTDTLLTSRVRTALQLFPEVSHEAITAATFDGLRLSRQTRPYDRALQIARLLILHFSPGIEGGRQNLLALLFDMNALWEDYVYRMLARHAPDGVTVKPQQSKQFWERKTVRPDLVITRPDGGTVVADAKWKTHGTAGQPTDADLKQMFVYNQLWECEDAYLIYPSTDGRASRVQGTYHVDESRCTVVTVPVVDGAGRFYEEWDDVIPMASFSDR